MGKEVIMRVFEMVKYSNFGHICVPYSVRHFFGDNFMPIWPTVHFGHDQHSQAGHNHFGTVLNLVNYFKMDIHRHN